MDINFLLDYINPIILGICLMVGFVLKTAFDKFPNKYIPLVALCMGTIIAILINLQSGINAEGLRLQAYMNCYATCFLKMVKRTRASDRPPFLKGEF